MSNEKIARILYEIADLLELKGVDFKPRAYRRAARSIEELEKDIAELYKDGRLQEIPGIGEAIAKKVVEIIQSGDLSYLKQLREEFPAGLLQIMEVPEIGPRTTMRLYRDLRITNLHELKRAAEEHEIRKLKGFGERSEETILKGIRLLEQRSGRMLLGYAYFYAKDIIDYLISTGGYRLISVAGSLRRMRETIGDVDILVGSDEPKKVMDVFTSNPKVSEVVVKGETKSSIRLKDGIQVDIRVVATESYGAALQYFTGSKEHNIALRSYAIEKGLKINEYGVFKKDTDERIASKTEEEVYASLGMETMPPEIRENRGEIKAAIDHMLPSLIELDDVKGDLHVHSTMSDGSATVEEIALEARRMGYEYVGIADHSESLKVARGVSKEDLVKNVDAVRKISERVEGIRVLAGAEVEILGDGSLDYPDSLLNDLDFVVGAVHSGFRMGEKEMTNRVVAAMSNEYLTILAHPTGRVIEQREPYQIDLDRIMDTASENQVFLEVNALPERLDLNDVNCKRAKDRGATLCIGTDAHSVPQLSYMIFGVATGRRGWLEANDVANTLSLKELENRLGI
ncbi:MAG: DNA polymerase/3'-5' exonuclease PolX [Methanomassiliicoccales archaeon]|nr:DNA polymerase/3'-5' exonuclease PolX [Methanomassiliicoccales archaeon]